MSPLKCVYICTKKTHTTGKTLDSVSTRGVRRLAAKCSLRPRIVLNERTAHAQHITYMIERRRLSLCRTSAKLTRSYVFNVRTQTRSNTNAVVTAIGSKPNRTKPSIRRCDGADDDDDV